MKALSEFRGEASAALSGKWGGSVVLYLVYVLVSVVASIVFGMIPFVGSLIGTLVVMPVTFGVTVAYLRQLRGNNVQTGWLFENFNGRVWTTMILQSIYTWLWSLLLIIPGIIKAYSYAMTPYILEDNPELENNAAIERSMAMMKGHKLDLFLLDLSFIGWFLLCILTLGIGLLWVAPYQSTAHAAFYEELKKAA